MAGGRQRCMYCLDSHGTDIEHFWPKSTYPKRAFNWRNLLLCCTGCGRLKGNRFPLADRHPLLIDPSKENPWRYLDFDPMTGNITARFDLLTNDYAIKGMATTTVLHLDRREALAAGYKLTYERLLRKVRSYQGHENQPDRTFVDDLVNMDDHGLLGWVLTGSGSNEPVFVTFRQTYPQLWQLLHDLEVAG